MFWSKKLSEDDIRKALQSVIDPEQQQDIVSLNWLSGVVIQSGQVLVTLDIDPARQMALEPVRLEAETVLKKLKGVASARVMLTAEKKPSSLPILNAGPPVPSKRPAASDTAARPVAPHVKHIIAVASGKGGVGKSTIAVNLALALQKNGKKTGLLDADVYGPSVPMLLGLRHDKPQQENDYLIPLERFGLKVMSMGFLVEEAAPMVWRGPMVQSALLQMLRDVRWGTEGDELDVLVLDMPPGTGDTQLTIAQRVKLSGAVIVSTPQDIALLDTVKGVHMFQKVAVPIFGIIENMSYFCCPQCGHEAAIFGTHGARDRAAELKVPFLGAVPLDIAIRERSDGGMPITLDDDHPAAKIFSSIALQLIEKMDGRQLARLPPRIVIEAVA